MSISIQKHRLHPVWKFYDEKKAYLGQILGSKKAGMEALAKEMVGILKGNKNEGYRKEVLPDKSVNIYNIKFNQRVAGFEKNFEEIAKAIEDNLK